MIQMYDSIFDLMMEFTPFFMLPIAIMVLSTAFRIVTNLMRADCTRDTAKELIREEKDKIDIDKDLQKYFNYKE